jgi:Zn-dependent protease with chaperone function
VEHVPFTTTIRALLAVAMLAGFYLVGVGLLAGLTWLSVWLWLAFPGQVAHDVSYLLAATAVGLAVPTWRLLRARPEPPPEGVPVSEQQAPELWSQVRALAESVGTRPPDEIRLVFEANAGVWEDARLLGLRPGRRCLYLGVPLLQACAVGQVRAVVAHELGHYSHHHTRLGALTYRGMQVIVHTILGVGPRSVGGLVFSGYAALYFVVSLAVMRRMELEADRAAVRAAGRAAAVLALRDTSRLRSVWEVFLSSYVGWNQTRGYTPTELLAWFAWLVEHRPTELDRVEREWAGRVPDTVPRWDSHPPIDERVAMIERETGRSAVLDARPGEVLVADLDTMAAALWTTGFDRHVEGVAQEDAERDADRLYHAAARVAGTRRRELGSVLDLLADGRGMELRRALAPPVHRVSEPDSPAEQHRANGHSVAGGEDELVELTFAAVAATAVASGQARWRHSWSEPMTLACDGAPILLGPLVTRACRDATGVAPLRTLLLDLGVDEASVIGWAAPGRTSLDIGPLFRTLPGTEPSTKVDLLLPDELFLLAYAPSGRRRINVDAFEAGLAAAALAELRLRARVRLTETAEATIVVGDATPTGDRFLDSVLARVAAGRPRPAYQWLQILGPDVTDAVARRLDLLNLYQRDSYGNTHPINHAPYDLDRNRRTRSSIVRALNTADLDSRALVLGALLWGTELAAPVLGRTALWPRFWLGRLAKRDQLAVAVRIVIGLNVRLPSGGSGAGAGVR